MSYIHDALKASSEQRKAAQGTPEPASEPAPLEVTQRRRGWSPGLVLLILLLGLLLYWFWRTPVQQPEDSVDRVQPAAAKTEPVAAAQDEPDLSGVKIAIRTPAVTAAPRRAEAPARAESPDTAPSGPPTAAASVESPPAASDPGPYADLPYLRQLPVDQQRELQEIRFTVHIYSDEPGSRLVKYDGRVLREGDFVRPGLRIEAIIPRGVVLQFRQTRFKVPAL
ncbi:general secretion pathway protein GspB [Marinobacterium sediminicola]|uniref:Type II secretion system protein B n=1 Tax=Marinobacterium sediminicola TaxID=518898 RepID=A0ABY1S0I6_9GAMM|nr:general secretion pathway protein GspB [Marinobacterium sediminicola]ULG68409.1 general secretion pathway protein GspB [Marinobacterium sediminicola]SMR74711.1 Type II secretion system protein B [Marinobacterium sediminicola]